MRQGKRNLKYFRSAFGITDQLIDFGAQTAQAVNIPIIGMGGIANAEDALEFIMAGATMVSVGTANFHNPYATIEVIEGLEAYMNKYGVKDIKELIGCVK